MSIRVAVAQFGATTDKEANLAKVHALIERAAGDGLDLVVLPENAMYSNPDATADISPAAESLDGPFAAAVRDAAKRHGIAVVAGMTEKLPDNPRCSNTVLASDAGGELIGVYRKVHLYDAFGYKESARIQPAEFRPLTFPLGGLTFGVMTCYDLRFPEIARLLVDAGANAIVVPAAWAVGPAKEDHWVTLARARAIENTSYMIMAGQSGPACTGQSMIIDPMGTVVASAGESEGLASSSLLAERVDQVRAKNPSLSNRRFTIAGTLT
ncbi:carbon-nitrogen hydrolase family protein [Nonomuraea turcica]|uniref:carbon-nitrogen hydrolase family protein n=1 Tax=Nonomuraea sp. G32 TaxID=3067274 RepID=UPI00273B4FCC|nr:carbon-nitrogen hydrolase family protein [Nonomuraea sp. G32]MDP4506753.1 carbon-nitrogen hydrolase family protein [Nonomuraea sp. G32]